MLNISELEKIKLIFLKKRFKEKDMCNKMVDISQNKVQKKCFIKKVGDTDYFDEEGNVKNRDTHLVFETKQDYNKIRLIDKMFKTYFVLEKSIIIQKSTS